MKYENNVINIRQFNHSPHPYYLPGFMDVFTWSMPFVAEKVAELLLVICNLVDDPTAEQAELAAAKVAEEREKKREALRNKVRTVSRMLRLFKSMREERQEVMKLGSISPSGKSLFAPIPAVEGEDSPYRRESLEKAPIHSFDGAKLADRPNEARPTIIVEAQRIPPSPDGIRRSLNRRASRDQILCSKKTLDFHVKLTDSDKQRQGGPLAPPTMVTEDDK